MTDYLSASHIGYLAEQMRSELVDLRRLLHQYPELSWEETHTADVISEHLESIGLTVQAGVGGYGLISRLKGELPGATVAYRADMDALPIQDMMVAEYTSTVLGVKHACGHDAHMTIAFGAAKILSALKDKLHGTVRFLFQPAEEALDGAQAMIANGALDKPYPQAILALHAFPLPVGTIGLTPGHCLAGMEEFRIKFNAPETLTPALINMTLPALRALSNQIPPTTTHTFDELIRHMVSGADLRNSIYLSCWQNSDDSAGNFHITGLVSMADYNVRSDMQNRVKETLDAVIRGTGVTYDLWVSFANPPVINDAALTRQLRPFVQDIVGRENVVWFNAPYPYAHEDFALYAQQIPASLLWLGTANHDKGTHSLLHTSDYDIDEESLVVGTAAVAYALLKLSAALAL